MTKEFEELKNIVAVHFGALGFLNPNENEQILKDRNKVLNALTELEQIKGKFDENKKSDITGLSFTEFKEIHKNDTPVIALDILHRLSLAPDYVKPNSVEVWARRFLRDKVEQALTGLTYTKPNEALICLNFLKDEAINDIACLKNSVTTKTLYQLYFANFDTIEQALVAKTKKEKAWDIVREKDVDLRTLKTCFKVECGLQEYNRHQRKENELTQDEYNLLKEAL